MFKHEFSFHEASQPHRWEPRTAAEHLVNSVFSDT